MSENDAGGAGNSGKMEMDVDLKKVLETVKKNKPKIIFTNSKKNDISHFLGRHDNFEKFMVIVCFFNYTEKEEITIKEAVKILGISRYWANKLFNRMCMFGLFERVYYGFFNAYRPKLDENGERIINKIAKEEIIKHRDCCIKKWEEMAKTTLTDFVKNEINGDDKT